MTRRSKTVEQGGDAIGPIAEMNPKLAERYGISQGDFIVAWSRYGYIAIKADITECIMDGIIQMSYHYWESCCNELTSGGWDLIAKTPTFKAAIQIKKIDEEEFLRIRELKRIKPIKSFTTTSTTIRLNSKNLILSVDSGATLPNLLFNNQFK